MESMQLSCIILIEKEEETNGIAAFPNAPFYCLK